MSSSMISESGWRPRLVTSSSSSNRSPAWAPDRTMSTAVSRGNDDTGTSMSSAEPVASSNGSTALILIVRSSSESSGEPQLEQNTLSGGLRCPQVLQNTYVKLRALDELGVGRGIEEAADVGSVGDLDLADPALTEGIVVQQLGRVIEGVVDRHHRAPDRGVDVRNRLGALDLAERGAARDRVAERRQLHEHDVTERVLGIVGEPNAHLGAVPSADPLVVGRVAQLLGHVHEVPPYRTTAPLVIGRTLTPPPRHGGPRRCACGPAGRRRRR